MNRKELNRGWTIIRLLLYAERNFLKKGTKYFHNTLAEALQLHTVILKKTENKILL